MNLIDNKKYTILIILLIIFLIIIIYYKNDEKQINKLKEIYFIRHGETEFNRKGLIQGALNDVQLNENGKKQSLNAGKYLKEQHTKGEKYFDLILTSPMIRCIETAEIIGREIGYKGEIIILPELITTNFGKLNGKSYDELNDNKKINNLNEKYGIETKESIKSRIKKVINLIEKINYKKILVVSHGYTIQEINSYLANINISKDDFNEYIKNCEISYYVYKNNKFNFLEFIKI